MRKLLGLINNFYKLSQSLNISDFLQQLSNKHRFIDRLRFCLENKLDKIGAGSSRITFLLPNNLVLKLAKNFKGIAQNNIESDNVLAKSSVTNSAIYSDPNNYWIVTKFAKKINKEIFKAKTNMDFDKYGDCLKYWKNHYMKGKDKPEPEEFVFYKENSFFQEMTNIIGTMNLGVGDLKRLSSYGEVDGNIVVIDFGLTTDIWDEFYKK